MAVFPDDSKPRPEGTYTAGDVRALQDMTEESIRAQIRGKALPPWQGAKVSFQDALANVGNTIVSQISGALRGLHLGEDSPLGQISDWQTALNNDMSVLQKSNGYCHAVQSRNVNAEWSTSNWRKLPFTFPYGPNKGAHIAGDGITIDAPGTWMIGVTARARGTGYGGGDGVLLQLRVFDPAGRQVATKQIDGWPGGGTASMHFTTPMLVKEPGYRLEAWVWSGKWRWWDGGEQFSMLAATKIDPTWTNDAPATVPDETESEAKGK